MNHDRQIRFFKRLKRVRDLLKQNVNHQPNYRDLIATLESIGDRLNASKLTLKIVSPSASVATSLQTQHEANEELRSLYDFETVSPISQLKEILQNCDLICLVYQKKHEIRQHHYKLIELAQKRGVDLLILVQQKGDRKYSDWQQNLDALSDCLLPLPCDPIIDLTHPEELAFFQRSLIDLATVLQQNRLLRIEGDLVREIKHFFSHQTASCWRAIKQTNERYCRGEPLYLYQQQFKQNKQVLNQFRQQLIREIKQALNHEKTDLLNPFVVDGLIFDLQQLINSTEAKIVIETEQTYLYLVLTEFPQQPFIHDYVLELCQQRINEIIADRWLKINCEYANGGLKQLVEKSNYELNEIQPLLNAEPKTIVSTSEHPSLDLEQIIDSECLKIGSRIPFDYNFTQSSWFRLFISALVGTAIYICTWLYLGTGKYIGFMIIIFQIINLITGQNIKKAKLKQQTKELKRIVDQKYQSLARTIVSYLTQTLIVAIDRECQLYQSEYLEAIAIAQRKLDELKRHNEEHKTKIENLKGDRDKILTRFD